MSEATTPALPPRSVAWRTAIIIFFISAIATADRMAINILIGPIKKAFGIGDFQVSLLMGFAFTSFYILFLLPIGWAADRFSRRKVLAICLVIWSLTTIACGWATGFLVLFLLRMLVGAGEAGMAPTVHGMIGDSFPRESLARPLALQGIGFQVGSAAGIAAAGAVLSAAGAGAFKGMPVISDMEGWRIAFITVGLPGIIALVLIPLMLDPRDKTRPVNQPTEPILPFLMANKGIVSLVLLFAGISATALGCLAGWVPEYLIRTHGFSPARAGATLGSLMLVAAFVGQGGYAIITDWLTARGVKDAVIRVGLAPVALSIPLIWLAFNTGEAASFTVRLSLLLICIAPTNAISNTMVQTISPTPLRSRMTALAILTISVIGFTLGPSLVGALSQYVLGEARLGLAIQSVVMAAALLSLLLLVLLRPRFRDRVG